jgi:hypothetical protein
MNFCTKIGLIARGVYDEGPLCGTPFSVVLSLLW